MQIDKAMATMHYVKINREYILELNEGATFFSQYCF